MERAVGWFVSGIFGLLLALLMWRLTHSVWGWLVLFIPGAAMVLYGWWRILRNGW